MLQKKTNSKTLYRSMAGIIGLLVMAVLAYVGYIHLLSPLRILIFQVIWIIPALLVTSWARFV